MRRQFSFFSGRPLKALVALTVVAAPLFNPLQTTVATVHFVGTVLVQTRLHSCLSGGLGRQSSAAAVLCAFDLLELDGEDLRREPIETRKSTLKSLLRGKHAGIAFNAHFIADGAIVYRQACALGCEGIVSKRLGSSYRSGRADCWVKVKNPAAPAVRREAEEDWN